MPTFQVTDPQSGIKLRLTGDTPPSEQELELIFSSQAKQAQPAIISGGKQLIGEVQDGNSIVDGVGVPDSVQPLGGGRTGLGQRIRAARIAEEQQQEQQLQTLPAEDPRLTERLSQIPEIGRGGLLSGEDAAKVLAIAPILLTTTNPREMADVITSNFPSVGVSMTSPTRDNPEGRLVAVNSNTGATVELNKPGLSQIDILQGLGLGAAFFPAGGAGLAAGGAKGLATLAAASGATQAGIETGQAIAGGAFDPEDVALATAIAPAGQVVGEKVLSPLARAVGGKVTQPLKDLIRQGKEKGIDILTTDLVPPETFAGRTIQQLGEKLGILGTGGKRAGQQKARIEVVEGLAQEMGLSLDTPAESSIFRSLKRGVAQQLNKAATIRNEAVDKLNEFGNVDVSKTLRSIDRQIEKQQRLRADADPEIINRLEKLKSSVTNANFELVKDLRSNLIDDVNAAFKGEGLPTKASSPLQAVKKAMDGDLLDFAKVNDREAASKWVRSNRIFADGYRKAKDTEIKRLLNKGEGTPEIIANVIKAGRLSELKRMNSLLGEDGRKAAQLAIVRDALTESNFFTVGANPDRFTTAITKPARQKAISVFFKGEERKQLEGITEVLQATRRAQQAPVSTATGQQLAAPVAAIAGAQFDAGISFGIAGALAATSRIYESAGMRNLLLRLANAKKGSQAERKILDKVIPFFNAALQGATRKDNNQ